MAVANPAQHTTGFKQPKDTMAPQTHANSFEIKQ